MIFFFQAEDGIRDRTVTGVQTCALPISEMQLVIYGTESLGGPEQQDSRKLAEVLVMKKGLTRKAMLQQITLFLHHALGSLQPTSRTLTGAREVTRGLANRKILMVDDDVRNVFALTCALEEYGMTVLNAEGGK